VTIERRAYLRAWYAKNSERLKANKKRTRAKRMENPAYAARERERARMREREARARTKAMSHAPRVCPVCEVTFTPANRSDQLYCSRACKCRSPKALAAQRRRNRASFRPAWLFRSERLCVGCGVSFIPAYRDDQVICWTHCRRRNRIQVYGVELNRRTAPPALVAIADAIKETQSLLKDIRGKS
jgi:hypothetical protein